MYMDGDGVEKDEEKTVELLRKAAHTPNAEALTRLGELYVGGKCGLTRSYKKALNCYTKAANMEYAPAYTAMGLLYESMYDDFRKATDYYKKAAELGDIEAKSSLSRMYYFGKGTVPDYATAKIYAEEASVGGDRKSMYLLAWMYYLGDGAPQDPVQALYWFSRCCSDYPEAMRIVGTLLEQDTPYRDPEKAARAMNAAAFGRDAEAIRLMGDKEVVEDNVPEGYFEIPYRHDFEDEIRIRTGIPVPEPEPAPGKDASEAPAKKKSFFSRLFGRN